MNHFGTDVSTILVGIGSLLLLGLATDFLGRKTALPRVTLLFLFGFLLGPGAFDLLPKNASDWMPLITDISLLLVGFLLGGKITRANTIENGAVVLGVSISVVLTTVLVVTGGLLLMGIPVIVALLLGGIATATDPAATMDVVKENKAAGKFTDTLQGIVGIDDAWGLIVFSIVLAIAKTLSGEGASLHIVAYSLWELGGAAILGTALGIPMSYAVGRVKPGQPTLLEALGMVLLCGGIAQYIGVSFLLSAMVLGVVVTNFAKHHERPFHELEDIEWPFMVLFFTLTGASLELSTLSAIALPIIAYISLRSLARLVGCWPGAVLAGGSDSVKKWMGGALLPQAGVAMGMALIASAQFPQYADTIIPVVVVATMFFELVGPIFTKYGLGKAGDLPL